MIIPNIIYIQKINLLYLFKRNYLLINLMNDFSQLEIDEIISKSRIKKNSFYFPIYQNKAKNTYINYRKEIIQSIKTISNTYLKSSPNHLDIFYLSILYLDIILSKNKIVIMIEKYRKLLSICCFLLSFKFIGEFDYCEKIIKNSIKNDFPNYSIFETKCLFLLDYNLVYTTVYDYLNMILINEDSKILYTCKSILYLYIENNSFYDYSPFLTAIAIIKFSRNINKIYNESSYEIFFKDTVVNNIEIIIQNEFKDLIEEEKNYDFKQIASTVDGKKHKRISLSNEKKYNIDIFNNDKKNTYNNKIINTDNSFKKTLNKNTFNSERKRNISMNGSLREITHQNYIINKRLNHYNINRINIDLGQISRLPFEQLAKLSIRYMKK